MTARRKLAAAGLAVLLASILAAALLLVHVHGWRDISVGTGTSYCGVAVRHVSAEFYCQDGH